MTTSAINRIKLNAETRRSLDAILELIAVADSPEVPEEIRNDSILKAVDLIDGILAIEEKKYLA